MRDLNLIALAGSAAALFALLWWFKSRKSRPQSAPPKTLRTLPRNTILVDGSNVLHWGQEPSFKVLSRVLRGLEQKGYTPIVYFDANVGYVLDDHYYDEDKLAGWIGIPVRHICVVDKGVAADEAILGFASAHRLRVVSNDKFRDWRVQFPHAAKKGVLVGGAWRDGSVAWRGKL